MAIPVFAVIGRWRARQIRGEFPAARQAASSDIPSVKRHLSTRVIHRDRFVARRRQASQRRRPPRPRRSPL